ncbi:MAG TPA: hypothetical protein VNO26_00400 [Candidatus Limnocylindria bacterium]|nr:hypothetical protein [Candidatus Limnocylindria bacterium]
MTRARLAAATIFFVNGVVLHPSLTRRGAAVVSRRARHMTLLDGRRAIVTSGASGIGRATARRLAAHGSGVDGMLLAVESKFGPRFRE